MNEQILHNQVSCNPQTINKVTIALKEGRLNYIEDIENFERSIEKYLDVEEGSCVAVSSGSAALLLTIFAIKDNYHKFIIPSYTCKSISSSLKFLNKTNIEYIDSDRSDYPSFNLERISNHEMAIIPHMLGYVNKINSSLRDNIIEDISQCLDGKINNRIVGSQSKFGIISLYATKQLTGLGSGGIIYCREKKDREFIRNLINLNTPFRNGLSVNLRMTGINSIYASSELEFIKENNSKRAWVKKKYMANEISLVNQSQDNITQGSYRAIIKSQSANELIRFLRINKINSIKPYTFEEMPEESLTHKNTKRLVDSLVSLPCHTNLKEKDINRISNAIKEFRSFI